MPTHSENEKSIFAAAAEIKSATERKAYLDDVCGPDSELRARITALLSAREDQSDFLRQFVPSKDQDSPSLTESPGTIIGRYKLLEKIGEGGMAVVYMAEQERPIRRQVALKIIKLGMDTKQVIARFEAERQALALMDHPNIARVYDASATDTGRPYFVMELVTGVSIIEYCDANSLNAKERLRLFIQVCNAVQHAHQKGIIHRDIKPSNVLVARHEGAAVPKVIDFGIAKATNQRLTEKTLFTRYAHIVGTPAYMSPEQAELSDIDIDTRSDIYSLGVLLYELLTGTTPFSEAELRQAGYLEMQRLIREQEPLKPSTKLTTLGETLVDIARHRSVTPDLLTKTVRGDLDWIVMKALEKARDRRYDNTSSMAMDVQRYLDSEPILARAPSMIYRLQKCLRRHRSLAAPVFLAAFFFSGLIIALALWHLNRIQVAKMETVEHHTILSHAFLSLTRLDSVMALQSIKLIHDSRHVGEEARLMRDTILANARVSLQRDTSETEVLPRDAYNYLRRAQHFYCLDDSKGFSAAMDTYRALLNPPKGTEGYAEWIRKCLKQNAYGGMHFGMPMNLGPMINSSYAEVASWISSDELELYLCSDRPDGFGGWDIWMTTRVSKHAEWSPPINLGPNINSALHEGPAFLSPNGLQLFLTINIRSGGYGSADIWVSTRTSRSDAWGQIINLGASVNSPADEVCYSISSDGLALYFADGFAASARSGGQGRRDIWVTNRGKFSEPWEEPFNLGAKVNSSSYEYTPIISDSDLSLFFTATNRPGGLGDDDIWLATRSSVSDSWGQPVPLKPPVNSRWVDAVPLPTVNGSTLYFCSDRPGGFGQEDIWQVPVLPMTSTFDPNRLD